MMENEIDKIFKQGLENKVETTFESDWQTFEKSLKSDPFYKSGWFLGMLALVLVATIGLSIFTLLHNEESMYSSRMSQENIQLSEKSSEITQDSLGNAEVDQNEISKKSEFNESLNQNSSESEDSESANANDGRGQKETGLSNSEGGIGQNSNERPITGKGEMNKTTAFSSQPSGSASANDQSDQKRNSEGSPDDSNLATDDKIATDQKGSINKKESTAAANDKLLTGGAATTAQQSKTANSSNAHSKTLNNEINQNKRGFDDSENDELTIAAYMEAMPIIPLDANVTREALESKIIQNTEPFDQLKIKSFDYGIFFGLEQNAILKTSPSFGVSVRKHFSKWTAELGVAYQQSGNLGWSRQSDSVSYGFARYENSIRVRTNKIDLLSLPLKLSYRVGGQSQVFAGFSPSILVNAHQEKSVFNDGTLISNSTEKGYLYKTQAPEFIYFLSAGYTYCLNEQFQFDFGLNYSFQQWNTSGNQPIGGFVKFYYTLR